MQNVNDKITTVLGEISQVLAKVKSSDVDELIDHVVKAEKIVTCGAGRVGMAVRGFAMRLGHFGFKAHHLGDTTVPSIGKGDLFLVASGSGETQTIVDLALIARKNQATIVAVTGNPDSRIGKMADFVVKIEAPSKTKKVDNLISVQPMTTLNEQSLAIFFDAVVLCIMDKTGETHDTMWARHSNLE